MNTLPPDATPSPPPDLDTNLTDTAPLVDLAAKREADFNRVFVWHGKELKFSIASELYYRELRVHANAPPLGSYTTMGDFAAEAPRILYCASLNAQALRALRCLPASLPPQDPANPKAPPLDQLTLFDAWVEKNIALHEIDAAAELANEIQQAITRARTRSIESDTDDSLDGSGNSPSHP